MRVIVSGGGTGGHIYPAIAVADKVMNVSSDSKVIYIGNAVGLEEELVPKTGYEFKMVKARWFDRKNPFDAAKMIIDVRIGVSQALKIMKDFKPDVVIGTGGYACVPVVMAGHKYGARTFIQEQNAYPGMANKLLERYVDNVFLGFRDAKNFFKRTEKLVYTGNPVRECFFEADKQEARAELGLPKKNFVLFVFGGSQGAEAINDVCYDLIELVNTKRDMTMIFGTGDMHYEEVCEKIKEKGIELNENIIIRGFMPDIEKYMAASDLVVERSGALSVAETTACGKAAIFIPSPNVTGNHQFYNAKEISDRGGAVIIEEKDLDSQVLIDEIFRIKNDKNILKNMSLQSRKCAPDKATDIIYSYFEK